MNGQQMGGYAFLAGAILAVLAGLLGSMLAAWAPWIVLLLVLLGLVVGFLNVSDKETGQFLLAAIALLAVGSVSSLVVIDVAIAPLGSILQSIVRHLAVFVAPAALIVALKAVYNLAKS